MKKLLAAVAVSSLGLWLASCAEPATEDEINQMCRRLGEVSGAESPEAARAAATKVGEEYDAKLKAVQDEAAATKAKLDAEQQAALTEAKPEDREKRDAIIADTTKKLADAAASFDGKIKQLTDERDAAVAKAKEAADAVENAYNEIVDKCLAESTTGGAAKPVAQCRIAAATKDAWQKCE
jgi:predicted HicB family RNase H-like nuclease